jgi:tetratricopeptide (TPR) repeat protein
MRFCVAVVPFWLRRIDLEEATRRFDQALSSAPAPTRLRARALMAAASIDFRSGTIAQGIARVEDGHAIASAIGDIESQWRSLQLRAAFDLAGDAADAAIPRLERALALARREALGAAEANSVHSLGIAYWMLGDLDRAEELVADSVDLFDALADSCARISSPIAYAETLRGRDRRGLRIVFEDTLQPFAEISCEAATGYALANWAGIARARGDLRRARGLIDESEMCFTQAGDQAGRAAALVRRGHLELAGGELEAGRAALIEAYEIRRARGDRRGFGLVLAGLGLIDTMAGDYKTAHQELADAATIFERAGDRWGIAITLWRTAELEHAQGDLDAAEAALRRARRVLEPTQRRRWIANTLAGLAEIALERGRPQQAVALLHDARERYAAGHDQPGVQDVEGRLRAVAKDVQSVGKEPLLTTLRSFQYQRRRR